MLYANGDIYEGEYQNDSISGQGILKKVNGDIYDGTFEYGELQSGT